jgi:hypothetical protein
VTRILSIELRRSVAISAAALIAATGAFVLFASNPPYRAWIELAIVQREIMSLIWPLAVGVGAWQALRDRRSRVEELLTSTPRPRRWRVLPLAAATAIAAVTAYLVMFAVGVGHLRNPEAYFPIGAVPLVVVGALALVAAVVLGLAIGTLIPSVLTPPILVVVGFVAMALLPVALAPDNRPRPGTFLLLPYLQGPKEGPFLAQVLSERASMAQVVWFVAVAGTGLALFAAARPATRVAALLSVVLGAAVAAPAAPRLLEAAWVEDRRATELTCTRDEPVICLPRLHAAALPALREPGRRALAVLNVKLPPAPTRVVVNSLGADPMQGPQPADTLLVLSPIAEYGELQVPAEDAVWLMLLGGGTRTCANGPGPVSDTKGDPNTTPLFGYSAARAAVAAWLLDEDPRLTVGGEPVAEEELTLTREALTILRGLPADEQRARVTALRDAERTCVDGNRMHMLTGTGRST